MASCFRLLKPKPAYLLESVPSRSTWAAGKRSVRLCSPGLIYFRTCNLGIFCRLLILVLLAGTFPLLSPWCDGSLPAAAAATRLSLSVGPNMPPSSYFSCLRATRPFSRVSPTFVFLAFAPLLTGVAVFVYQSVHAHRQWTSGAYHPQNPWSLFLLSLHILSSSQPVYKSNNNDFQTSSPSRRFNPAVGTS